MLEKLVIYLMRCVLDFMINVVSNRTSMQTFKIVIYKSEIFKFVQLICNLVFSVLFSDINIKCFNT